MKLIVVFGTVAAAFIHTGASAGEFGLRVFRDRAEWLAEASEGIRVRAENFDMVVPQSIPDNSSLLTGPRGVRLSTFNGARMSVLSGGSSGNLNGTSFVDVSLYDSTPWIELGLFGGAFAWAAEFSGTSDGGQLSGQFGDILMNFGQYFEEDEGGFLGFVTSSIFNDVRLVAGFEGEEFSFDNLEWVNIPAPSSAVFLASGAMFTLGVRRRRVPRATLAA
jgi:hypothetical protein